MLSDMDPIDLIVTGHQSPRIALPDRDLESPQIQLSQRSLGDFGAVSVFLEFLLVTEIVLRCRTVRLCSDSAM
jgi:hypothetical protein